MTLIHRKPNRIQRKRSGTGQRGKSTASPPYGRSCKDLSDGTYDLSRIEKGQRVSPIDGSSRHSIRCDQTRRLNEPVFILLLGTPAFRRRTGGEMYSSRVFFFFAAYSGRIGGSRIEAEDFFFFVQLKGVYIFLVVTHLCCWPE